MKPHRYLNNSLTRRPLTCRSAGTFVIQCIITSHSMNHDVVHRQWESSLGEGGTPMGC